MRRIVVFVLGEDDHQMFDSIRYIMFTQCCTAYLSLLDMLISEI